MEEPYGDDLVTNLNALHDLLLTEESLQDTLQRVAELASTTIGGCDAVGVTIVDNGNAKTAAATDGFTLRIDKDQYDNNEGPCLHASTAQEVVVVDDIRSDERWPAFAAAAAAHGLASSLSIPLAVRDTGVGALNLYARTEGAFDKRSQAIAKLFGSQASVALSNAQVYVASLKLAEQLHEAIKSREVIGQAKGILMASEGVSDAEAFEMLKRVSQSQNVKVRDIAQKIVDDALRKA